MAYAIKTARGWRDIPCSTKNFFEPAKADYWWRSAYTSLRRNMNNDDLVDRFDAICGEVIDPRRDLPVPQAEIDEQLEVWDKLAA